MMNNRVIYGIGNIHGQAEILLQEMCNIYIHTDEHEEINNNNISIRSYIKRLRSSNF